MSNSETVSKTDIETFLKIAAISVENPNPYLTVSDDKTKTTFITYKKGGKEKIPIEYEFDRVFTEFDEYSYIYENIANNTIQDAMSGISTAFVSYGETLSEKHSILFGGFDCHKNLNSRGIFPRLLESLIIKKDISIQLSIMAVNSSKLIDIAKKIKQDGKIREFYQEWMPMYINENLPTGWGYVNGVYKCHRIGFSKDVIEYAINNHMNLRCQEKEILNEIANCLVEETKQNVTNNRNEQSEKRHSSAVNETSRCSEETRLVRCRESYIGVGFVVNRECHSSEATYTDYTKYNTAERTVISKIK